MKAQIEYDPPPSEARKTYWCCKPPNMGAGNQTLVLKSKHSLIAVSPIPTHNHYFYFFSIDFIRCHCCRNNNFWRSCIVLDFLFVSYATTLRFMPLVLFCFLVVVFFFLSVLISCIFSVRGFAMFKWSLYQVELSV